MALHRDLTEADNHYPQSYSYANEAARLAATGFVAADYGKFAVQLDNNSLWRLVNHSPITWVEITTAVSNVFGSSQAKASSESEESTTSTSPTFAEKVELADTFTAGTYAVHYSYEIKQETTGQCDARVTLDGSTIGDSYQDNNFWVGFGGFKADLSLDGSHTFKVEWARTSAAGTAWIRRARLWVYRIA